MKLLFRSKKKPLEALKESSSTMSNPGAGGDDDPGKEMKEVMLAGQSSQWEIRKVHNKLRLIWEVHIKLQEMEEVLMMLGSWRRLG